MASLHNMLEKVLQCTIPYISRRLLSGKRCSYGVVHIELFGEDGDESAFLRYPLYAADSAYSISYRCAAASDAAPCLVSKIKFAVCVLRF
jgi:hypothetical protein